MSLSERISAAFQKKAVSAKERYIQAVRTGDDATIIAAAEAAGISAEQIQADARIIDRAAELAPLVERLPAAQKALADANQRVVAAKQKLEKTIAPLQQAVDEAAWAAQQEDARLRELKPAVVELRGLFQNNPELLNRADAPAILRAGWQAEEKVEADNHKKRAALMAERRAREKVESIGQTIHHLRYGGRFALPNCLNAIFDPAELERDRPAAIEKAEAALAAARKELAEAILGAEKIGLDVTTGFAPA